MRKRIGIGVLLGALCLTTALRAQDKMPMPFQMMGQGHERMMGDLNLSDDQKKEVDKLRFDFQKQMIAEVAKVATMWVDYRQLLSADMPDKAALEKKFGEMTDGAGKIHSMLLGHWFAVNKVLNAEQQKKWKRVLEHPMGFMGGPKMRMGQDKQMEEKKEK